jgi:hypothetical protein
MFTATSAENENLHLTIQDFRKVQSSQEIWAGFGMETIARKSPGIRIPIE